MYSYPASPHPHGCRLAERPPETPRPLHIRLEFEFVWPRHGGWHRLSARDLDESKSSAGRVRGDPAARETDEGMSHSDGFKPKCTPELPQGPRQIYAPCPAPKLPEPRGPDGTFPSCSGHRHGQRGGQPRIYASDTVDALSAILFTGHLK